MGRHFALRALRHRPTDVGQLTSRSPNLGRSLAARSLRCVSSQGLRFSVLADEQTNLQGVQEVELGFHRPNWKRRCEVPDRSILDAARQFEAGRRILWKRMEPGCGILLPALQVAAVSIELHLKCLGARLEFTPDSDVDGVYIVNSSAAQRGHCLADLLKSVHNAERLQLDDAFTTQWSVNDGTTLSNVLDRLEGLFVASRYPFEKGQDPSAYSLAEIAWMCDFLSGFVKRLEPREWIEWTE